MLILGLLWYDDDARRPVPQKIADAVSRYQERLGGLPTVCQLNPRQAAALASAKAATLPPVRLMPEETLRPNYFFVGIEEGDEIPRPSPELDIQTAAAHDAPTVHKPRRARAHAAPSAPRPAVAEDAAPPALSTARGRRSAIAPSAATAPAPRARRTPAPARETPTRETPETAPAPVRPEPAPRSSGRRQVAKPATVIQLEMPLPQSETRHPATHHRRRAS